MSYVVITSENYVILKDRPRDFYLMFFFIHFAVSIVKQERNINNESFTR